MTLTVKPAHRWSASMAELPTSSKLILFGGKTTANNGYNGLSNDTWSWDGSVFANISTGISGNTLVGPSPRAESTMAFDKTYVTLVGGTNGIENLSETWSYSTGSGWFKQALTNVEDNGYTIPTLIRGASSAYQSGVSGGEVILFGGTTSFERHYSKTSWVWVTGNPGSYTLLSPTTSPTGRMYASMASSATTAILFGGKNFDGPLSDIFSWNGSAWTAINTGQTPGVDAPAPRYAASFSYCANDSVFVLHGGISTPGLFSNTAGFCNDSWSFSTMTNLWSKITGPQPPARAFASSAYLTATTSVYLFGGLNSLMALQDLWSFSVAQGWQLVG